MSPQAMSPQAGAVIPGAPTPGQAPPAPRAASLRRLMGSTLFIKLAAGVVLLGAWQFGVGLFAPRYVARPLNVIEVAPSVLTDPEFLAASWATLSAVLIGLAVALIAGTAIGMAMGRVRLIDRLLSVYVSGFYVMPMVAILPLIAVWFGYDSDARLATVIFAGLFSIAINAGDGARAVPHEYIEVAHAFRAPTRSIWLEVALPASAPYLIAGVRLAAGRALVGAVIAEFYTSTEGLGMYILSHTRSFQHNEAVVGVLMLAAFGLAFEGTTSWATRRFLPWYRRDEQAGGRA
jgi:NitT/TauT family transport system permease protein